jgi:acetyl-CoA carboxylase biotin carboxyl carrier protein
MSHGDHRFAEVLTIRAERDADGWELLSPAVGYWAGHPASGALIGPGTSLGRLTVLNRTFELVVPDGLAGRLDGLPRKRIVALGYGEPLGRVTPLAGGDGPAPSENPAVTGDASGLDLEAGCHAVVAPTDGVFYTRPHPDSPPFVEAGGPVVRGQAVGLVEVMKTFNQILYEGPGFPDQAEVVEVRAEEAEEVRAGQVLVVVR